MCSTEPAAAARAASPHPMPESPRPTRRRRRARMERVSLCFLCSLWLDEDEQRCCHLCGPLSEEVTP